MDGDYAVPTTPTSGVAVGNMRTFKKRLSDGSTKSYSYPYASVRKHFELTFTTDSDKLKFEQKCEDIRLALGVKSLKDVLVKVIMDVDTNKLSSATQHPQQTLTMSSVTEEVSESTSLTDPASVTAAISAAPATALETAHENFVGQHCPVDRHNLTTFIHMCDAVFSEVMDTQWSCAVGGYGVCEKTLPSVEFLIHNRQ